MKYSYYPIKEKFLDDLSALKKNYKKILQDELSCNVSKNFFKFQDNYYPIKIKFAINVIEKNNPIVGSFNPLNLSITLNYHYYLLLTPLQQLNLIRHELAHYIDYILRGHTGQDHDAYFHKLCMSYGWDQDVYAATINTFLLQKIDDVDKKVKKSEKLISLANNNSSWQEAESALLKAKAMLNSVAVFSSISQDDFVAIEILSGKRLTQKYQTILQILELYDCKCIVLTTPGHFTLEVITTLKQKDSILDLFEYLDQQIDLWFFESKKHNIKLHRQSFYRGLQKGLQEKMQSQFQDLFPHQKALISSVESELNKHFQLLYPRTTSSAHKTRHDLHSFFQGKNIAVRLEIKNKLSKMSSLLDYFK